MSDNNNSMNKLSKKKFIFGMEYLNTYYVNLKIDLDNSMVQLVWYDVFKTFSDDDFERLIKAYCVNNIYPPQSPSHILEYAKSITMHNQLTGDEAWEYGYTLIKKHRFDVRSACDEMNEKGYRAMAQSFLKMGGRFRGLATDDVKYVKKDWIERYNDELEIHVKDMVIGGTLQIGSGGNNNTKLIDEEKK